MNKPDDIISLSNLEKGKHASIIDYEGHGHHHSHNSEFINRLENLGLRIGSEIEVLHNAGNGPVMLKTSGTRLALGRGMSHRIIVKKTEP